MTLMNYSSSRTLREARKHEAAVIHLLLYKTGRLRQIMMQSIEKLTTVFVGAYLASGGLWLGDFVGVPCPGHSMLVDIQDSVDGV